MSESIRNGKVVSLAYTLKLDNGEIADEADENDPLEYLHGAENIIPGLEQKLEGLTIGDTRTVVVTPEDGYGVYDPEAVETLDRADIPDDVTLELGMPLMVTTEEGDIIEAIVREITPTGVKLDMNHELAGQTLHFDIKVLDIRDADEEELEHGHPHGMMDMFDEFGLDDDDDDEDDEEEYDEDDEDFEDDEEE